MNNAEKIREWALARVGGPYIYGCCGWECTPARRWIQAEKHPSYTKNITKYCKVLSSRADTCAGCRWEGMAAYDCASFTDAAAKEAGLLLCTGASSQWNGDHWTRKGPIAEMPPGKVCFLYRRTKSGSPMGHTGICLGDETAVDCRGHASGVVHGKVSSYAWTDYAVIKGMEGEDAEMADENITLRKGDRGPEVTKMQELLILRGYPLPKHGADGDYGNETESALRAFQAARGLEASGVCNAETRAALEAEEPGIAELLSALELRVKALEESIKELEGAFA